MHLTYNSLSIVVNQLIFACLPSLERTSCLRTRCITFHVTKQYVQKILFSENDQLLNDFFHCSLFSDGKVRD